MEKYLHAEAIGKIYPTPDIMEHTVTLLAQYPQIKAQEVFDLYLVATMLPNGVHRIYTYNQQHFNHFQGIEVLTS